MKRSILTMVLLALMLCISGCEESANSDYVYKEVKVDQENEYSNLYLYNDLKNPIVTDFNFEKCICDTSLHTEGAFKFSKSYIKKDNQVGMLSGQSSLVGIPFIVESFSTYKIDQSSEKINESLKDIVFYNYYTHKKIFVMEGVILTHINKCVSADKPFVKFIDYSNTKHKFAVVGLPYLITPAMKKIKTQTTFKNSFFDEETMKTDDSPKENVNNAIPTPSIPQNTNISPVFNNNITINK